MNDSLCVRTDLFFITITVIDWIDIFNRPRYKKIVVDSLEYCQKKKGLIVYAWVLMSNHLHAIVSSTGEFLVSDIIRDFKKHTSKHIVSDLESNQHESRREWMLSRFRLAGANDKKISYCRLWRDGYYPELISSYNFYLQKLEYIHNNPVRQEIVARQEDYIYSSAIDYAGGKGMLDVFVAK